MKNITSGLFAGILALGLLAAPSARAMDVSFEEDHSLPLVRINVAIKAGFVTDPEGQSGVSNFMATMLRQGTRTKTKTQIDLMLDQMGAALAVESRAESIVIRGEVLSSQLGPFLSLLSEILAEPSFPEKEIKKEKSKTVSALLEEQGSDQALEGKFFQEFLFRGHPYGKSELGKIKDVSALTRQKVVDHYNAFVHDKNLIVVGTGDAPASEIKAWSAQLATRLPTGNKPVVKNVEAPSDARSRRLLIIDKPERTQTQMSLGQVGVKMTDPRFFALYVGNYILGGPTFSSRLMNEIRVKRGWSYGAGSGFRFGIEPRYWRAHLFPAAKDAAPALAETLHQIELAKNKGVTEEEFKFTQSSLVAKSGFTYNTPEKRVENALLEKTLGLPDGMMKSYGERIAKVDRDQVNAALGSYLNPDAFAITVLATAQSSKEALAQAANVPLDQVVVVPYTDESSLVGK